MSCTQVSRVPRDQLANQDYQVDLVTLVHQAHPENKDHADQRDHQEDLENQETPEDLALEDHVDLLALNQDSLDHVDL